MKARELSLFALLIALLAFAWIVEPTFVTMRAQALLSSHIWELAIVALPMLLIVVAGGIDLSVGSLLALCAVVLGLLFEKGLSPWLASATAIVVGLGLGSLNGWFVSRFKIHPLLITLATLAAFRGIAEGISLARPISGFPENFQELSGGKIMGLPYPGLIFFALAILTWIVLTKTVFGRWIFAIGNGEKVALFSKVPTARVRLLLYAFSGICCGIAATILVARNNTAKADLATGLELDVITAVVLGGAKIEGGEGSVVGLLLGIILIHETREFVSWHWRQSELNLLVIGGLLIAAVLLQQLFNRRSRVVFTQSA